jgi:hypothetical protein
VPEYLLVYRDDRRAERLIFGPDHIGRTTTRTEWRGLRKLLSEPGLGVTARMERSWLHQRVVRI